MIMIRNEVKEIAEVLERSINEVIKDYRLYCDLSQKDINLSWGEYYNDFQSFC